MAFKPLSVDNVDLGNLKGKELDSWRESISQSFQPFKTIRAFKTGSSNETVSAVMTLKEESMVAYNIPVIARAISGSLVGEVTLWDLHRGLSSEVGSAVALFGGNTGLTLTDTSMPTTPLLDGVAPTGEFSLGLQFLGTTSNSELQYAGFIDFAVLL